MTLQSKDQQTEIGALARVSAAGFDATADVIGSRRDLDSRVGRSLDISNRPSPGIDRLNQAERHEEARRGPYPSDRFPLQGATGETIADWQHSADPSKIDGAKVKDLDGSVLDPGTPGTIFEPEAFGDGDFEAGSIEKHHLHQEVLDFIEANGGSQEAVGLDDFGAGEQAIILNAEKLPPADTVIAADPSGSQITLPIWDTANHKGIVPNQFHPFTRLPFDDDPFDRKWMFGRRIFSGSKDEAIDHYHLWTFDPVARTATFEDDGTAGGITSAECIIHPGHFDRRSGFGLLFIPLSVTFRILEIDQPGDSPNLPWGGYEFGVTVNRKLPGAGPYENSKGHGWPGKFNEVMWMWSVVSSYTQLNEEGSTVDRGHVRGFRIQIQARKVTITDPVVRFMGVAVDPEYRASERVGTPTAPWQGDLC